MARPSWFTRLLIAFQPVKRDVKWTVSYSADVALGARDLLTIAGHPKIGRIDDFVGGWTSQYSLCVDTGLMREGTKAGLRFKH